MGENIKSLSVGEKTILQKVIDVETSSDSPPAEQSLLASSSVSQRIRHWRKGGWISTVVPILIILAAMDLAVYVQFNRVKPNFVRRFELYKSLDQPPDVVFMGDSRVANGVRPLVIEDYITQTTGKHLLALNMAMAGSGLREGNIIAKRVLKDDKLPKVIIYGFTDDQLTVDIHNEYLGNSLLTYVANYEDFGEIYNNSPLGFEERVDFLLSKTWLSYRYRNIIGREIRSYGEKFTSRMVALGSKRNDTTSSRLAGLAVVADARGWVPVDSLVDEENQLEDVQRQNSSEATPSLRYDYGQLDNFLRHSRERNVKVIFVHMPSSEEHWTPNYTSAFNDYWTKLDDYLTSRGAELYNLNDFQNRRKGDLPDGLHLSPDGAQRFSLYLAQTVLLPLVNEQVLGSSTNPQSDFAKTH